MAYVDGFLIPVPDADKETYRAFAQKWGGWFKDLGALSSYECWGDEVPPGDTTDFARSVELQAGETVVFSWTIWPDKATREAAWKKMTEIEPEEAIPFDGKRMVFGGFRPLVAID